MDSSISEVSSSDDKFHRLAMQATRMVQNESLAKLGADVDCEESSRGPTMKQAKLVPSQTLERFPDKTLLHIFCYLHHKEVLTCARVCKKWHMLASDSRLWKNVCLRPEHGGLQVTNADELLALIGSRFGPSLTLIELPMDLITVPVLHELANKCPQLRYLTLDFSGAAQLSDFNDLISFPARLNNFTVCLSDVIFLEGFMRKIYTFISSVHVLHVIGTFERIEDEEEEVYEVLNLHKLKQHLPNLVVVNLFGVIYLTDEHVDSISATCTHIEVLGINFCQKVTGTCLKVLFQRCKRLRTLLMEQCLLKNQAVMAANWDAVPIEELNITATDLSAECLQFVLDRVPHIRWLSAGFIEAFNDDIMDRWLGSSLCRHITAIDLNTSDSLNETVLLLLVRQYGHQLEGLSLGGMPTLVENFWMQALPNLQQIKILIMGIAEDCCSKVTARIHVDQFLSNVSDYCQRIERLEIRWDPERLRFSERSSKFIDVLRLKCQKLRCLVLADGPYFELVKSNFERTGRMTVVRTTETNTTSLAQLLRRYNDLMFN